MNIEDMNCFFTNKHAIHAFLFKRLYNLHFDFLPNTHSSSVFDILFRGFIKSLRLHTLLPHGTMTRLATKQLNVKRI